MSSISDLDIITQDINYFTTVPIPENLYIYLEKWYPYLIMFPAIFLIIYLINRYKPSYFLNEYYPLLSIFIVTFVIWTEYMVIPRLEIMGSSKLDIPTEATVINYVKILFILAIILFLIDYFESSGIIHVTGMMLMSLSFIYLVLFCALFVSYDDGNLTLGHISSNTDSEYKIGHLVSIPVKMGGPDTGLSITLSSEKPGALKELSSLNLNSSESENQINNTLKSNGYLTGKAIDTGKYKVDINTTSLDPGYYNLRLENLKYKQISSVNTFYLSGQ